MFQYRTVLSACKELEDQVLEAIRSVDQECRAAIEHLDQVALQFFPPIDRRYQAIHEKLAFYRACLVIKQ